MMRNMFDDRPESSSSVSSKEVRRTRQKHERPLKERDNEVCVPEPQTQMTFQCVDETPTENMPATPTVENEVCGKWVNRAPVR